MFVWVGPNVQPTDISAIWGVNSGVEILDGPIPEKDSELNSTVRTLIQSIVQQRGRHLKLHIIRVGHPDSKVLEAKLRRLMVITIIIKNDKNNENNNRRKTAKEWVQRRTSNFWFTCIAKFGSC